MNPVASCFICSTSTGVQNTISLIQDTSNLQSGKKLLDIVSEITEKPLKEEDIHSTVICKKCCQTCKEYDDLQVRLKHIKTELRGQIHAAGARPLVLPASKLHPLPPGFVLRAGAAGAAGAAAAAAPPLRNKGAPPEPPAQAARGRAPGDGLPLEIDGNCTYAIVTQDDGTSEIITDKKDNEGMFDMSLLAALEAGRDRYLVGKLELLSDGGDGDDGDDGDDGGDDGDGDDDEQTIVVAGEQPVLRVVSRRRLLYAQRDAPDDDEAQIELQVSGDEETANAIIAAAKEQGGAFIKVETGEMYRVKSVESKSKEDEIDDDNDFTDHMQIVEKEDGEFKCVLCKKNKDKGETPPKFSGDAEFIMRHMRVHHDARVYICRTCGRALRRRDQYLAHTALHTKENSNQKSKFHECTVCNKKYSSKTLLQEHSRLHGGRRPYACDLCHKSFASKYTHQSHLKTHLDRPRPFKCADCGKCFFTLQNLNQHHKTHSGVKEFECRVCGKAFGTQHNLEMHGVVHSGRKPFVCGVCARPFARRAEVRDHMRVHTGERPFACEVCGAAFSQRSNLHSHRRATHLDDKRHQCAQCPKRFKRRRLLEYHTKAAHTGERPLKCAVCAATFVYPEHYKKHARIHSGEKPYVCEVCGKSFNSRDNRNTHRFVHSDKKPYECLVCGAGYMRKQLLYTHMNTSGHLAESIVVNQPRVTIQRVADSAPGDNVYESAEELELGGAAETSESQGTVYIGDKKYILQEGKTSLNLVQDTGDILTYSLDSALKTESNYLEGVSTEPLAADAQVTAAAGGVVRVLQVRLPDGHDGWVAVNP